MGIEAKHFYRFQYLKSEHWQNLRIEKLASVDAHCFLCDARDLGNDVHHVEYRNYFDVKLEDLVVLCRGCHSKVHKLLDDYTEDRSKETQRRLFKAIKNKRNAPPKSVGQLFSKARKVGLLVWLQNHTSHEIPIRFKTEFTEEEFRTLLKYMGFDTPVATFFEKCPRETQLKQALLELKSFQEKYKNFKELEGVKKKIAQFEKIIKVMFPD